MRPALHKSQQPTPNVPTFAGCAFYRGNSSFAPLLLLPALMLSGHAVDNTRLSREDDIREAVFQHQFDHNASAQQKSAKVYFLSLVENGDDPSDEFMKRFANHNPPVRKASACKSSLDEGAVDKQTGEKGLIFRINAIKWVSDTEVEVKCGYHAPGESASGNTYILERAQDKWNVTKTRLDWISQEHAHPRNPSRVRSEIGSAGAIRIASQLTLRMPEEDAVKFLEQNGLKADFKMGDSFRWIDACDLADGCSLVLDIKPKQFRRDGAWADGLLHAASIQCNGINIVSIALTNKP